MTNATVATMTVNGYLCPSDGNSSNQTLTVPGTGAKPIASTNYANNLGVSRTFNGGMLDGPAYILGTNTYGSTVTLAGVLDGTSNTVIFSEWVKGTGTNRAGLGEIYRASSAFSYASGTGMPALMGNLGLSIQTASSTYCQNSVSMYSAFKGYAYMEQTGGLGGTYSHLNPPNKKACIFSSDIVNNTTTAGNTVDHTFVGPSSNHPGGVNCGFLDGSVRFIKDSVNLQTWGSIATKAGGEVIDASSF